MFFFLLYFLEVRIKYPFSNAQIDIVIEEISRKNKRVRHKIKSPTLSTPAAAELPTPAAAELPEEINENVVSSEKVEENNINQDQISQSEDQKRSILMVEVVNVQHDKFRKTEEVKVRIINTYFFI